MSDDFTAGDGLEDAPLARRWAPVSGASAIPEVVVNSTDPPEGLDRVSHAYSDGNAPIHSIFDGIDNYVPPAPPAVPFDLSGLPAFPTYFDQQAPPVPDNGMLHGPEVDDPAHPLTIGTLLGATRPPLHEHERDEREGGRGDRLWCIQRCADLTLHDGMNSDELNRCIQQCMGTNEWPQWAGVFDPKVIPGLERREQGQPSQVKPPQIPWPALAAAALAAILAP